MWKYMEIWEEISEPLPHALPSLFVNPGKGLLSPGKGSHAHELDKVRNLFFSWESPSSSPLHSQGRLYNSLTPFPQRSQSRVLQEGRERENLEAWRQRASLGEMSKFRGLWVRGLTGVMEVSARALWDLQGLLGKYRHGCSGHPWGLC